MGYKRYTSQTSDIDFVITWVDGNDRRWQGEKAKYKGEDHYNINNVRYRDWNLLHYWFRSVERYAPWVRKIHFVTCGQRPEWLNTLHPKLNMVNHSDYMKKEYLPTFSSHPIELNLHRIKGLTEKFVYFNDDIYVNAPVMPEDFFQQGLPCDSAILSPIKIERYGISNIILNNLRIINDSFDFKRNFKQNFPKWISPKYKTQLLRTLLLLPWRFYLGFYEQHIAYSYLKSSFEEVWQKEEIDLHNICTHKFRDERDVNQWLIRYWQIASGRFIPRNVNIGKLFSLEKSAQEACNEIKRHKYKLICINDSEKIENFEKVKCMVQEAFKEQYPRRSSYEL